MNDAAGRPHFGPMPSLEREIGDFTRDVLLRSRERLVLAEFWAPWSAECRVLRPALERAARRLGARVALVSVNIEMHAELLEPRGVHGLPMVKAYFKSTAIGELTGILPEAAIARWIASLFDAARQGGLLPPLPPPATSDKRPTR